LESQPRRRDGVEATDATPLALQDVSFEYVPGRPVLESLRLTVHRGETVGIIGPSGGGKSTLVQLLLGLRQPTAGRIVAGGVDLAAVRPASWAALTRLVPQDNEVIYGSVADNIRFYRSDATDAAVRSAAERAHLAPQIEALPEGYDTMIGLGAHTLSGGQRQRLGIARALLGDPALLILDEPTSALDPLAERMVLQTLRDIKASTTMILVAHRRSTLAICDRVVRIHEGTLTEVLDREELLDAVGSMPEEPPFPSGDAS
jgi:ATP-binding cassette subfamily B protein